MTHPYLGNGNPNGSLNPLREDGHLNVPCLKILVTQNLKDDDVSLVLLCNSLYCVCFGLKIDIETGFFLELEILGPIIINAPSFLYEATL